jgi:hypothetical protein
VVVVVLRLDCPLTDPHRPFRRRRRRHVSSPRTLSLGGCSVFGWLVVLFLEGVACCGVL